MTRTTLTDDGVFEAMRGLLVEGEYPSLARVRSVLGTTASQQTLQRRIHEQWAVIGKQLDTGQPLDLPDPVVAAARTMWRHAGEHAKANLEKERELLQAREQEFQDKLTEAQTKATTAVEQTQRLDILLDKTQGTLDETKEELAKAQAQAHHLDQQREELGQQLKNDRKQAAAQLRHVRHTSRTQIAQVEAERERLTEALRLSQERMESQQAAWAKQIDEARQAEMAARAETQTVRDKAAAELERVATARDRAEERARALGGENQGLQKALTVAEQDRTRLHESLENVQSKLDASATREQELERSLASQVAEAGKAQALADERQSTISMLNEELRQARAGSRKRASRKKS
ncbi:DNA-binding protein [Endozoicomonas sp. G2_2]|uniref:DNA-binding protein n=1 Tax=Endozoicomonas sp. G2_2 TaxID=2821092 RepID=UPI001ADACC97|nr:DNA-binding protein [Endozoicomonas sp. G2_2]MBO9471046.1 DNA-binding protein [Endozoicomonas sp. G2_2]